jgi:hypothetical protein
MNEFIIIIYFGFKDHLIETFSLEKICRLWEAAWAGGSSDIADCGFRIADFGLRISDCGFRIADCGFLVWRFRIYCVAILINT